jgi:hypothetical protein
MVFQLFAGARADTKGKARVVVIETGADDAK